MKRYSLIIAITALINALACAGNIPHYSISNGTDKYSEFTDGVRIPFSASEGDYAIFPGGKESSNPLKSTGFPIGFDFIFGGQYFDQFVVDNGGRIYFGKGEVAYRKGAFNAGMTPIKNGISSGEFRYKLSGIEGNRVLVIQLSNAIMYEDVANPGKYSLQVRLYESSGNIEFAFYEIQTTSEPFMGFELSLNGWNKQDAIVATSSGLDKNVRVSDFKEFDFFDPNSYVTWSNSNSGHNFQPVILFSPCNDQAAPDFSPQNLKAVQNDDTLTISCDKGADSSDTVILYSTMPISENDFPCDGITFPDNTVFGNSKVLYYGSDAHVEVDVNGVSDNSSYYICALPATGYPVFGRTKAAYLEHVTTQSAPEEFKAEATGPDEVRLSWESEYPVIVAMTTQMDPGYGVGYKGIFGMPDSALKAGDSLIGGGNVVYAGNAKDIKLNVDRNRLTFFRIWSVKGECVSATSSDAFAVAQPSLPFAPDIENYPCFEQLAFWQAPSEEFLPIRRDYRNDPAIRATSINGATVTLVSPKLDLTKNVKLTFDFAIEKSGMDQGNSAGDFGSGALDIIAGGKICKSINNYGGKIVTIDGYPQNGSTSFETVSVIIPPVGSYESLSFRFRTDETTFLFLRNILVEESEEAPSAPTSAPSGVDVYEDRNTNLQFYGIKGDDADYTLVLASDEPLTEANHPIDGTQYRPGDKIGNATVVYCGDDAEIMFNTDPAHIMPQHGTTYYVAAYSASIDHLFNRENYVLAEYVTIPEAGDAIIFVPEFDAAQELVTVKAQRHPDAAFTILLLSESPFKGSLSDCRWYSEGDVIGNAVVLYQGRDEEIEVSTSAIKRGKSYYITAVSANTNIWWSDRQVSQSFVATTVGIDGVMDESANNPDCFDVYNLSGIKINMSRGATTSNGIYVINGKKIRLKSSNR